MYKKQRLLSAERFRISFRAGFTLIELLVVVLIISILAAVALPQYQTAVYKARTAELFLNLKTAVTAADAYYLANGTYPSNWLDLDISLPYKKLTDDGGVNYKENGLLIMPNDNTYGLDVDGYIYASASGISISRFYKPSSSPLFKGSFICRCGQTNKAANQACLSLGGIFNGTQNSNNVYGIP